MLQNVKIVRSKPLSDAEAVELGSDMIAEIMIWGAAAIQVLGIYYWQQSEKDIKAQKMNEKFENIQENFDQLKHRLDIVDQQISYLNNYIAIHSKDDNIDEEEYRNLVD